MLIDEEQRKKYDEMGKEGIDKSKQSMDSKAIFEMVFGSEKFVPLLGELRLASMMNLEDGQPSELLDHRQKKREIQIALNLIDTLKPFMDDEIEEFQEKNDEIAKDMTSNSMGKLMLGKIAIIYAEQANQ